MIPAAAWFGQAAPTSRANPGAPRRPRRHRAPAAWTGIVPIGRPVRDRHAPMHRRTGGAAIRRTAIRPVWDAVAALAPGAGDGSALEDVRATPHLRMMEWEAPAIVLDARPLGEGGAVVTLLTEEHGRHPGLVRGGAARGNAATWLPGNLVEARWVARLADQLGNLTGELVHPAAALAMEDPLALALLSSACAVAAEALPEREPHPRTFRSLVPIIAHLGRGAAEVMPDYVRWEVLLLADLGYGLDLTCCAATGATTGLTHVSPRSGRAVSADAAAPYLDRLLPLPRFLLDEAAGSAPTDWAEGLRLTGHFLARDACGARHRPVPAARETLSDRIATLAAAPA